MKAVEYPDCFRYCGKNVVPERIGVLLSTILWRCAYLPVSIEARLDEHNAVVTNAFLLRGAFKSFRRCPVFARKDSQARLERENRPKLISGAFLS